MRGDIPGGHAKNLFVKDKKGRLFLLVLGEETAIDLKRVHEKIGAQGRVSFGSAELLEEVWGVQARRGDAVRRDQRRGGPGHRRARRGDDARTSGSTFTRSSTRARPGSASADLVKFLRATGHEPVIVALGGRAPVE